MTRYSVQSRDRIFVKGNWFLSFNKNMGKSIGKNINKNLSAKYSQKLNDHAKKICKDPFKIIQKSHLKSSRGNWWFGW